MQKAQRKSLCFAPGCPGLNLGAKAWSFELDSNRASQAVIQAIQLQILTSVRRTEVIFSTNAVSASGGRLREILELKFRTSNPIFVIDTI